MLIPTMSSSESVAMCHFRYSLARLMLGKPFLIIIFADVGDVHPSVCHLVDGALAPADSLVRVGIVRVGGGIVMSGGDADYRALWEHRRGVLCVNVIIHPVERETVDVAQHLGCAVRQDRFHGHGL